MSTPDIRAMEDMLDHLRAKKAFAEAQLQASESKDPALEWDLRRIEAASMCSRRCCRKLVSERGGA